MTDSDDDLDNDPLMVEIARLQFQKSIKNANYYWITVLGNENGTVEKSISSHWVGYTETKPEREIRAPSFIDVETACEGARILKEPYSIVNNEKDLYIYMLIGGHGFIEKTLAEKFFPNLTQPRTVIKSFSRGYLYEDSLPKHNKTHAPTKKVRMNVLKRDDFRCKVCGRSPDNYVDIELHVHHILPWGQGGITEEDNLITLCNTCHDGLEPHFEPMLFKKLGIKYLQTAIGDKDNYADRLRLYMDTIRKTYFEKK